MNLKEFHIGMVKIYGPLRKGVQTKHSAHLFNGKVGPAAATIFTDVGQGYYERVRQTPPGPEALVGLGLSILRAPSEKSALSLSRKPRVSLVILENPCSRSYGCSVIVEALSGPPLPRDHKRSLWVCELKASEFV